MASPNPCNIRRKYADESLNALDETRDVVRIAIWQIVVPIVCVIGVTANIMNIVVLARPRMSSSTNIYLLALAICDLFYGFTFFLLALRTFDYFETMQLYMTALPTIMTFGDLWNNYASWLTCAFTIERFIAISSPMLARKVCTRKRSKWIVGFVCIFSVMVTVPDLFSRRIRKRGYVIVNGTSMEPVRSETNTSAEGGNGHHCRRFDIVESRFGEILTSVGWPIINIILVVFLPLILLTIFNALLIRSVIHTSVTSRQMRMHSIRPENSDRYIWYTVGDRIPPSTAMIPVIKRSEEQIGCPHCNSTLKQARRNKYGKTLCCGRRNSSRSGRKRSPYESYAETGEYYDASSEREMVADMCTQCWPVSDELNNSRRSTLPVQVVGQVRRPPEKVRSSERHRITVMLIVVVVAFCIFTMPSAVVHLIKKLTDSRNEHTKMRLAIAGSFVNLALAINSSLNFFLYSWLSKRFRQTFYTIIKCHGR
ncbi:unnamed protein product [Calicophoron daubneyi]|uniref:G-protein coupled receptors family 1 profile domain-containing protein n=1 Tax=Calicophoron daubneyi TaxID=300641 RepID=A0AAV2T3D4_CALDB